MDERPARSLTSLTLRIRRYVQSQLSLLPQGEMHVHSASPALQALDRDVSKGYQASEPSTNRAAPGALAQEYLICLLDESVNSKEDVQLQKSLDRLL